MTNYSYKIRQTTDEEFNAKMPYLTSSMVEAVNTCPRWGIIHNVLGKRFTTQYRQMALEAGSLMHDVFSALNLLQVGLVQGKLDHMHYHAQQPGLFGKSRWDHIWKEAIHKIPNISLGDNNALERLVYAVIGTSDFYDDPNDRNRTIANLERCALELYQYWQMQLVELPIYINDLKDCEKPIGIEMSLDAVFELDDFVVDEKTVDGGPVALKMSHNIRCIGLADALYQNPDTKNIALGEYKTAASMNDAWQLAFDTRHQITLYNALLQAYFGRQETFNTILIGSAIPVRTTTAPVRHFNVDRDQENIVQMLNTFDFTQDVIKRYTDEPLATPMFTHSCNRYFRPCSQLDLCTASADDQQQMLMNMEVTPELSPSEEKAMLRSM